MFSGQMHKLVGRSSRGTPGDAVGDGAALKVSALKVKTQRSERAMEE